MSNRRRVIPQPVSLLLLSGLVLVIGTLLCGTPTAHAQAKNYELFRTDTGLAAAYVPGIGAFGGGAVVEPKVNVTDQLALGLRTSALITGGGSIGEDVSIGVGISVAVLGKAEYFLTTSSVRPFLGVGAGYYHQVSQSVDTSGGASAAQGAGKYFGVAPQVGLQLGGFRLALTYNALLGAEIEVTQSVGGATESKRQDFLSLDLAFQIRGAKISK